MGDLEGRCGTCGFFRALSTNPEGVRVGECMLGCWPAPLHETGTCTHHKPVGTPWDGKTLNKGKRSRSSGRGSNRRAVERPAKPALPQEIDIDMDQDEFRSVLREVLLEELGIRDVTMGDRWEDGELVLVPGRDGTQEKRIPLNSFFHKVVMIRDKLRVLEQKINGHGSLSDSEKVQLQQYITGCYGSLTSFNILFRDREDGFSGAKKS